MTGQWSICLTSRGPKFNPQLQDIEDSEGKKKNMNGLLEGSRVEEIGTLLDRRNRFLGYILEAGFGLALSCNGSTLLLGFHYAKYSALQNYRTVPSWTETSETVSPN